MNTSLAISKSGLQGLQTNLDVVANNIANVNTTGYKQKEVAFQELLLNDLTETQVILSPNSANGAINRGVKVSPTGLNNKNGSLEATGQALDLAINGLGFFGVRNQGNELMLTRSGNFHFDEQSNLVNESGQKVEVNYLVPKENWPQGQPSVGETGVISFGEQVVGQIVLFQPENMNDLRSVGHNQYEVTNGRINNSLGNHVGFGSIQQGFLEASNVDLASSMTDLILTQRAYSLNSRVLQATDEMMQRTNEFN